MSVNYLGIEVNPLYDAGRRKSSLSRLIRQVGINYTTTRLFTQLYQLCKKHLKIFSICFIDYSVMYGDDIQLYDVKDFFLV